MSAQDDFPLDRGEDYTRPGAKRIGLGSYVAAMAEIDRLRVENEAFRQEHRELRLRLPVHARPYYNTLLGFSTADLGALISEHTTVRIMVTTDGVLTVIPPEPHRV